MKFKILNKKYHIVAVDMPGGKKGGIHVGYDRISDTIMINKDAPYLDKLVKLIDTYLDVKEYGDDAELILKEAEKGSSLQELIDVIDRIDHIRRHGKE